MALTRKALAAMGIEAEKIDQIIEMHTETVNGLKDDISKYKADAEKLPEVQKKVDSLKEEIAKYGDEDGWKSKYDKVQKDFEDYKKADKAKAELTRKTEAFKALVSEVGAISSKRLEQILKCSADEINKISFDTDGKVKDADTLKETIAKEWDGFFGANGERGANVPNPPANNGKVTMSRSEIFKRDDKGRYLMDSHERQAALAKLLESEQKG